jgi:hypothetical protein
MGQEGRAILTGDRRRVNSPAAHRRRHFRASLQKPIAGC